VAPMFVRDKSIGIIAVGSSRAGEGYSKDDLEMFKNFAAQAAVSIENTQLYERLQERTWELSALSRPPSKLVTLTPSVTRRASPSMPWPLRSRWGSMGTRSRRYAWRVFCTTWAR